MPRGSTRRDSTWPCAGTAGTLVDDARDEEIRIFGLLGELDHPRAEADPRDAAVT